MFTKNFYKLLFHQLTQVSVNTTSSYDDRGVYNSIDLLDVNAVNYSNFYSYYIIDTNLSKTTLNLLPNSDYNIVDYDTSLTYKDSPQFIFGTGTKVVSIEDYKLDSIISTTDLSLTNNQYANFLGYNIYDMDIKNNSDKPITISEIGILVTEQYRNPSTNKKIPYKVLISRDLLKEPLEIKPNETKNFVYKIGLNI